MITLHNDAIADRWMRLLPECTGKGIGLLDQVERDLQGAGLPGVTWTQATLAGAKLKGMLGGRRDALVVHNEQFHEFTIVISCWDYGTYLQIVRFLVSSPKLATSFKRRLMFPKGQEGRSTPGAELDVLLSAELDAWIAVTDFCLREAIESLIGEEQKGRDPWDLLTSGGGRP